MITQSNPVVRFFKIPALIPWLFRGILWKRNQQEKVLYLTFDDGPIPGVTEFVLDELKKYDAKATFFCVGDNVRRHQDIALKVKAQGHILANHTFHHVKAWQTGSGQYKEEVNQCQDVLEQVVGPCSQKKLFRPPHGQLTWKLLRMLRPEYQVVMWSSLSYDFDASLSPDECLQRTVATTGPGAIIVFHDSLKAERNLRFVLPQFLAHFAKAGYMFKSL